MRILLFHFGRLGGLGGVEVAVLRLAEAFSNPGHRSGIVELGSGWSHRTISPGSIPVWTITGNSYPALGDPRSWASLARTTAQLLLVMKRFAPDIVHVHYPSGQSMAVVAAHMLPHSWRLVTTVHNSDIRIEPFQTPQIRPWQARLLARADAVTAVSESLLQDTKRVFPRTSANTRVIWNGVSSLWFQTPHTTKNSEDRYVLFVGRIHQVKGVDLLLKAWQQITVRLPGVKLWIVGDGPEREPMLSLTKELGIGSTVKFLGAKKQQELPELYYAAEAVVLPSRREGLPFSLLEAAASAAIRIGTNIPGIAELIEDGKTGFLVEPESADHLAGAILRVLNLTTAKAQYIREAARFDARQRFSEEAMIGNYLQLFEDICYKKPGRHETAAHRECAGK